MASFRIKSGLLAAMLILLVLPREALSEAEGSGEELTASASAPERFWAEAEFLYWFMEGRKLPPLVTTSPPSTPSSAAGVLSDPATLILFGDESVDDSGAPGARLALGTWLDAERRIGIGARGFGVTEETVEFSQSSDATGVPILALPFFNAQTEAEDANLAAFLGTAAGSVRVRDESYLWGAEAFLRFNWLRREGLSLDLVGGYQYAHINDELSIESTSVLLDPGGSQPQGTTLRMADAFDLRNDFHGGALGLLGEYRRGRWSLSLLAKLGLGGMRQEARVGGSTTITLPGDAGSITSGGGLFALPTNSGSHSRWEFAVVPEIGIDVGLRLTRGLSLTLGYSFVYWSAAALAGDQIDRTVNPSQLLGGDLDGPARPSFSFDASGFWAQGLNAGVILRF